MKNNFDKFLLVTILTFAINSVFNQTITVGPEQKIAYGFEDVFPVGENSFFVKHYDKMSGTKMIVTHYTNFVEDATTGPITSDDSEVLVIDGKLIVYRTSKKGGIATMTAQEYGPDCLPVGDPKALMSYKMVNTIPKELLYGSVIKSENGEYFASIFRIVYKDRVKYSFHIYDKSFKSIKEGIFDTSYESYNLTIDEKYLTDLGNLYFSVSAKKEEKTLSSKKIWKLENDSLNEIELSLDGFYNYYPKIYESPNGTLQCAGMGREKGSTDPVLLIGVVDFTEKTATLESSIELSEDFIGSNHLKSIYQITNIVIFENGNMALVIDQYGRETKSRNINGVITTQNYTTYFDIKVLMVNKNHDIIWTSNLGHANQISYFGKYRRTFCLDTKDDELVFYMNLSKTRTGMEDPQTFTVAEDRQAESDNCLGKISVDFETGETKRTLLCDQAGCNWESAFTLDDYNKGVIVTFHKGLMNYRFGLIK